MLFGCTGMSGPAAKHTALANVRKMRELQARSPHSSPRTRAVPLANQWSSEPVCSTFSHTRLSQPTAREASSAQ